MGDADRRPGAEVVRFADPARGTYRARHPRRPAGRRDPARRQPGGRHVTSSSTGGPVPADRRALLLGRALGGGAGRGRSPADAGRGEGLPVQQRDKGTLVRPCWRSGARTVDAWPPRTRAATGCGGCGTPSGHRRLAVRGRIGGGPRDEATMRGWSSSATAWSATGWSRRCATATTTGAGRSRCSPRSPARRTTGCALSVYFDGGTAEDLTLPTPRTTGCELRLGDPRHAIDRDRRVVTTATGEQPYDALVLATGSCPFVPPVPGTTCPAASSTAPSRTWTRSGQHAQGAARPAR